ncbi:MAG TPA: hypothetical protein VL094_00160 [Sphingomonadaceae bacterium]|nr:hypothetical protein [Sphingomonadaceae bacterium]
MYETNIVRSGGESPVPDGARGGGELRRLSWRELAARLASAQDFRRLATGRNHFAGGSFNYALACHLAALDDGKPDINPIALANGKIADGKDYAVTSEKTRGDRGR